MKLQRKDGERFFRVYYSLLYWADKDLQIFPDPVVIDSRSHKIAIMKLRKAVFEAPKYINTCLEENPDNLGPEDVEMVESWQQHCLKATFAIMRHQEDHSILLSIGDPILAYGVLGINDTIRKIVGPNLPQIADDLLLPFMGRIIIDGVLTLHRIRMDARAKQELDEAYEAATAQTEVITTLPTPPMTASQQ